MIITMGKLKKTRLNKFQNKKNSAPDSDSENWNKTAKNLIHQFNNGSREMPENSFESALESTDLSTHEKNGY